MSIKQFLCILIPVALVLAGLSVFAIIRSGQTPTGENTQTQTQTQTGEVSDSTIKSLYDKAVKDGYSGNYEAWLSEVVSGALQKEEPEEGTDGLQYFPQDDGTYAVGVGTATELSAIVIPKTHNGKAVTAIKDSGFQSAKMVSLTIPDSVKTIGKSAFSYCTGLTSVTIPDGVTSIGGSAFYGCTGLTSITIGNSVTSIGDYAFWNCAGLTSITIPDSVTSIGYEAFRGCTGLTSVTIGNGVKSIGVSAFYKCTGLTSVMYNGTKAQWNAITKGSYWNQYYDDYNWEYITIPFTVHCTDGDISYQ